MSDDNLLGTFLRDRREAITPAEVGLPAGARRRTPGLRRAELAMLADISVEYLARLEQGRDRHPSPQVLLALADALRLSDEERVRLRNTAKANDGLAMCPEASRPVRSVRPTVRALLERLEPAPAVLLNRLTQVLAFTDGYARLAGPAGLLDGEAPSVIRYVFLDPRAREAFPDWDGMARHQVAALRAKAFATDPHVAEIVDELGRLAGPAFTERWAAVAAAVPEATGILRWAHPEAGELRLAFETLELPDEQQVLVYLPGDEAASAALDRLTGLRPGTLRAVNG